MKGEYNYGKEAMDNALKHGVLVEEREKEAHKIQERVARNAIESLDLIGVPDKVKENVVTIINDCVEGEMSADDTIEKIKRVCKKYPELLYGFVESQLNEASAKRAKQLEQNALDRGFSNEKITAPKPNPLDEVWSALFASKVKEKGIRK